jgi:AcrR family transcriptional regulator
MPRGDRSPRADHAAKTRQALVDAALEHFAARGYENTTTEEIAEAAGVSPRTFFRYFPTKESVLFFGEYSFIKSFTGLYLAQPETMTEVHAMCASFVALAPSVGRLRQQIKVYHQAVASSPTLLGRERQNHQENRQTVAHAIAQRRGLPDSDASCELLASVGVLLLERAMDRWLSGPARAGIGEALQAEFATLGEVVGTDRSESMARS